MSIEEKFNVTPGPGDYSSNHDTISSRFSKQRSKSLRLKKRKKQGLASNFLLFKKDNIQNEKEKFIRFNPSDITNPYANFLANNRGTTVGPGEYQIAGDLLKKKISKNLKNVCFGKNFAEEGNDLKKNKEGSLNLKVGTRMENSTKEKKSDFSKKFKTVEKTENIIIEENDRNSMYGKPKHPNLGPGAYYSSDKKNSKFDKTSHFFKSSTLRLIKKKNEEKGNFFF